MRESLKELQRALAGELAFSQSLERLAASLFRNQLPETWSRLSPPSQKPLGSWLTWLLRRHSQLSSWATLGEPAVMWLGGLHVPETYLAALVQSACRARGWSLDNAMLCTKVRNSSFWAAYCFGSDARQCVHIICCDYPFIVSNALKS